MIKIDIKEQGAPIVNCGSLYKSGPGIALLEVDLHSKYCEVSGITGGSSPCSPGIIIEATERSLNLDETKEREATTWIEFPEYIDWSIWAVSLGRYTMEVCLVK